MIATCLVSALLTMADAPFGKFDVDAVVVVAVRIHVESEMSKNVLVEKCVFDQGDDGIVIKSGRNRDAWRINRPTENVLVRDCEIRNAHTVLGALRVYDWLDLVKD